MHDITPRLIAVILLAVLSACSVQNERSSRKAAPYSDSVTGLMRFYSEVSDFRDARYLTELKHARDDFQRSQGKDSRMRLAILLMNTETSDAAQRFREAETLLNDYIQAKKYGFFDEDYSALAAMLLTINKDWQKVHRQMVSAKIESGEAKRKLEELKSIEMHLNRPGNDYH